MKTCDSNLRLSPVNRSMLIARMPCPIWKRYLWPGLGSRTISLGRPQTHTPPTHQPHSGPTGRVVIVRVWWSLAGLVTCGRPLGPRGSAAPDLTPTPRGPEGEVRNGSAAQQLLLNRSDMTGLRLVWGTPRVHPSPQPQGSPEVSPTPLSLPPPGPARGPAARGKLRWRCRHIGIE
jgi:hypothetical protein